MIQERTVYAVVCDACGKDHTDKTDFCGWNDKTYAEDLAIESGWRTYNDGKHICPDCVVKEVREV